LFLVSSTRKFSSSCAVTLFGGTSYSMFRRSVRRKSPGRKPYSYKFLHPFFLKILFLHLEFTKAWKQLLLRKCPKDTYRKLKHSFIYIYIYILKIIFENNLVLQRW
jgi:hypothetical protein